MIPTAHPDRKSPTALTDEHVAAIKRLSALDVTQAEIGRRLGISGSVVSRVQKDHGIRHLSRLARRAAARAARG